MTDRRFALLEKLGATTPRNPRILDFGCGAGSTVYALRDAGYDAVGYDMKDYLSLRAPEDREHFFIGSAESSRLPFEDNTFDLIISEEVFEHVQDQVTMLKELLRITRPGGHALHVFPARYCPIEPHIYVPFGGLLGHRWWYKLWAIAGIRNEFQKGLTADETANRNAFYFVEALNYVSSSCYEIVWHKLGYQWEWIDREYFATSARPIARMIGKLCRVLPIGWLLRTFSNRRVYLKKLPR